MEISKKNTLARFIGDRRADLHRSIREMIPPRLQRTIAEEDILQEVFLDMQEHIDGLGELAEPKLRRYLLRSARSHTTTAIRRAKAEIRGGSDRFDQLDGYSSVMNLVSQIAAEQRTPSSEAAATEAVACIIGQLDRLNRRQIQMVRMHFLAGLSHEEIADLIGTSHVVVRSVILRARRRVAALLGPAARYVKDA